VSGGAWGYQSWKLKELGEELAELLDVVGQVEHELDWGVCGDTCRACARLRVAVALEQYFAKRVGENDVDPIEVLEDRDRNQCDRCAARA
jgi:hypothetical protein